METNSKLYATIKPEPHTHYVIRSRNNTKQICQLTNPVGGVLLHIYLEDVKQVHRCGHASKTQIALAMALPVPHTQHARASPLQLHPASHQT